MKKKNLHKQAYDKLKSMCVFGRKKSRDKRNNDTKDKIYSYKTFTKYWEHTKIFVSYVKRKYGECDLKDAKQYVNEWLKHREETVKSAWTVHEDAKAMGKLYQISPNDEEYYKPPKRDKDDIKRSRNHNEDYAKRFNEEKYKDLVHFCKYTGLRRRCLVKIENDCLFSVEDIENEIIKQSQEIEQLKKEIENLCLNNAKDANNKTNKLNELHKQLDKASQRLSALYDTRLFNEKWFIEVKHAKGGKRRFSPILENDSYVREKMNNTYAGNKVWPSKQVKKNCDVHGYRRMYAQSLYKEYARDVSTLPPYYYDENGKRHFSRYYRRGKNKGIAYDREVLVLVSIALGHGKDRATTVVDNYL